jgi:uncharacterized membrane protein HdeD (DUF308 family)
MTTRAVDGTVLLIKKVGGLVLIIFGILSVATGFETGSMGVMVIGIVALAVGLLLLALKIVRRNAGDAGYR